MKMKRIAWLTAMGLLLGTPAVVGAEEGQPSLDKLRSGINTNEPTYIKSDSLTIRQGEQTFVYSGNVEVKQGEMTLTAAELTGSYGDDNRIKRLEATSNVIITQGDMRGTSQKATYDAATEIVELTENPELQQNGSILTADLIRIFLKEERSVAEGAVRVKVAQKDGKDSGVPPPDRGSLGLR